MRRRMLVAGLDPHARDVFQDRDATVLGVELEARDSSHAYAGSSTTRAPHASQRRS